MALIRAVATESMPAVVVIGFAEALSAPEVTWSLVDEGNTVVAFSRKGSHAPLWHSRYVNLFEITPPERNLSESLADLRASLSALKQRSPGKSIALMPLDDVAILLCENAQLDAGISIIGPRGNAATLALDKREQIQLATKSGFSVPPSRSVESRRDLLREPVNFPFAIKPALAVMTEEGHLRKGRSWVCSDTQEMDSAVNEWREQYPLISQPFISGKGEGLFGLATENGVIGWSAHRRLRMMNPQGSGSSACVSRELDQDLRLAGERFIAACGWRGLFMIELLRDESGKPWFMEFNGRAWGSMALARRLGFEYPAWAVRQALANKTQAVPPQSYNGPLVCRHLGRELLHLLFSLRGPKSKALTQWPSPLTALAEILHFGRNERWYNWRADDRWVFFGDLFSTLYNQLFKAKA